MSQKHSHALDSVHCQTQQHYRWCKLTYDTPLLVHNFKFSLWCVILIHQCVHITFSHQEGTFTLSNAPIYSYIFKYYLGDALGKYDSTSVIRTYQAHCICDGD